jgi:calmodulin
MHNSEYFYFIEQLNELFSKFKDNPDVDTIHVSRLLETLQAFGRNPSQIDCDTRITELEADGKKIKLNSRFNEISFFQEKFELTFEDFLQILDESWTSINNDRNILRRALEKCDHSKQGFIDIEQFRTIMRTLGEPLSDDEIDGLIQLGLNDEQKQIDIECKFLFSKNEFLF